MSYFLGNLVIIKDGYPSGILLDERGNHAELEAKR